MPNKVLLSTRKDVSPREESGKHRLAIGKQSILHPTWWHACQKDTKMKAVCDITRGLKEPLGITIKLLKTSIASKMVLWMLGDIARIYDTGVGKGWEGVPGSGKKREWERADKGSGAEGS